jgi:hypothetical protein
MLQMALLSTIFKRQELSFDCQEADDVYGMPTAREMVDTGPSHHLQEATLAY